MKKLTACLFLLLMPVAALAQQNFDFKEGISWGMKQSQVASLEKTALHRNSYSYIIDTGTNDVGLDTTLAYFFTQNDKLAQIAEIYDNYEYKLVPMVNYTNFTRVRTALVEQYGDPTIERSAWKDFSDKTKFNNDETAALVAGKVEMLSSWNLLDTDILLSMSLNQNRIRIIVVYQSKEHADTYFKEDAERQKNGTAHSY